MPVSIIVHIDGQLKSQLIVSLITIYFLCLMKEFEKIESEWPLFYINMILEAIFKGNDEQVEEYHNLLKPLLKVDKYGGKRSFFLEEDIWMIWFL